MNSLACSVDEAEFRGYRGGQADRDEAVFSEFLRRARLGIGTPRRRLPDDTRPDLNVRRADDDLLEALKATVKGIALGIQNTG